MTIKPATPLPWEDCPFDTVSVEYDDEQYILHACNEYPKLEAENKRLREALQNLITAIHAPEVEVSTVADEAWSNVMAKARAALKSGTNNG